jgi:exopolysaccharide production protein ExoY
MRTMKNSGIDAHDGAWSGDAEGGVLPANAASIKRAFDLVLALPLLIFVAPLMLLIAVLIRLSDGGPAIFSHARVGRHGALFQCHKFRSMHVDADARLKQLLAQDPAAAAEWAQFQKLRRDPRVTPLGRLLRKTSLDELPQLFNIVRGEMGVVGPRPVTAAELQRYGADSVFYKAVRPGVLGLWQVNGRNMLTYEQRVAMDAEYVRTWTPLSDVRILFKAVPVVLFGKGAF